MRIHLLGFMASGKSTLGPVLAEEGGLDFVDLDDVIVAGCGRSISEIFRTGGEDTFRALETEALESLAGRDGLVLATGGGVVEREVNHAPLLAAHSVYLYWRWEELVGRLGREGDESRPVWREGEDALAMRWRRRDPLYRRLAKQVLLMQEAGEGKAGREKLWEHAHRVLDAAREEEA